MAESIKIDLINFSPDRDNSAFAIADVFDVQINCIKINQKLNQEIGSFQVNKFSALLKVFQDQFSSTKEKERNIKLTVDSSAINFDISFVGLIVLFKSKFPNVSFEISLQLNDKPFFRFSEVLYALNAWNFELTGTELYSVTKNGKKLKPPSNETERVFPIFKINPDSFSNYFVKTDNDWNIEKILSNIPSEKLKYSIESLYSIHYATDESLKEKNYRLFKDLINEYRGNIQWKNNSSVIFKHYVKMLCYFDLATDQTKGILDLANLPIKKHKKYGLSDEEMLQLKKDMTTILSQLNQQPVFFNLLFSILAVRNLERKVEDFKSYTMSISELFAFTKNMFLGIREIARNIVEHTSSKEGIISARIYDAQTLLNLKTADAQFELERFVKKEELQIAEDYLDIIVFDEGEKGIIAKTIENVKTISNSLVSDNRKIYLEDISNLENGKTLLKDFYNLNDFKLNYHAIKASSHWGLIIFTNLITKNRGFTKVVTNNSKNTYKESCVNFFGVLEHSPKVENTFATGTYYNVILPLDKKLNLGETTIGNNVPKVVDFSTQNHIELLKYQSVNSVKEIKNDGEYYLLQIKILDHIEKNITDTYRLEFEVAKSISMSFKENTGKKIKSKFLPVLDFAGCEDRFEQSKLIRLIGSLQLFYDFTSLIITNIRTSEMQNLSDTLSLKSVVSNKSLWNGNHFVLVYSYTERQGKREYQTDIIGGSTYNDWNILRNKLFSTHLTYYRSLFEIQQELLSEETKESIRTSPIFIGHNNAVQNFELILKYDKKNLYEYAIEYILDKEIDKGVSSIEDNREIGYRIADSHFKLGSKTHIQDFIYAKRLFQIGYYTNKFAFQVSQYIIQSLASKKYELKGDHSITLIGYAEYSQMLLNRVERILSDSGIISKYGIKKINHDLLNDVDTLQFIKEESINQNIIIIVPINTTFSTSIKIEIELVKVLTKRFTEKYKVDNNREPSADEVEIYISNFNFFEPFINIILVSHNDLNNAEYVNSLNKYLDIKSEETEADNFIYPYKVFKWRSIESISKEVVVETNKLLKKASEFKFFEERKQKYFISVTSKWYLPDTCIYCFPKSQETKTENQLEDISIIHERALLETDKTSVTPDLLLELPQSFKKTEEEKLKYDKDIWLNESCHRYGHFVHMHQHYLHFIEANGFFNFHLKKIREWAKSCREILELQCPNIFQKSVLLISPSERNNTYFLEFVNRYFFDDSASIIHYEVKGDYVENYQKFFKEIITKSDYIFYVDDFIKSGNTFHLVNDFVKYCNREYSNKGNKACSGLISLISKADNFSKRDIISLLSGEGNENNVASRYLTFYELNIYNISAENCPICFEKKRYLELADNSILDTVKHYFLTKVNKLREQEVTTHNNIITNGWEKFHPLVKDNYRISIPWYDNAKREIIELYETYQSDRVPGKKYLKILIENELNYLLSNDKDLQKKILDPIAKLDVNNGENIQKNKDLLKEIIEKLKQRPPFSKLLDSYNQTSIELFDGIFYDLVIKVFTLQPFVNIKHLREKSFSWVIIELHNHLNKMVGSKSFIFNDFRRLKFLLRRATLMGSNYAIRSQTLLKIKLIFKNYSADEKQKYEKARVDKYNEAKYELGILTEKLTYKQKEINDFQPDAKEGMFAERGKEKLVKELIELKNKISYIEQLIRNIEYKNNSLHEFNYFYVSLIKELLIGNESKVIKLEENVNEILNDIDKEVEKDFYYLLKLIQYENTIIIKQGLKIIVKEYIKASNISFENKFSKPEVRKALIEGFKNSMGDTRLSSLKKFIGFENFDNWLLGKDKNCTRESFYRYLHLLYLLTVLSNEDKNSKAESHKTSLENKTKTILQNIFRIACDPNFSKHNINETSAISYKDNINSGAFITLKFRSELDEYTKPDELFLAYATKVENQKSNLPLLKIEIDEESLSYFMINGLCKTSEIQGNNENLKPRTILEFKISNSDWLPVMSDISPIEPKFKNRNSIKPSLQDRFSKIYKKPVIKNSFTENIFNEGNYSNYGLFRISKLDIVENNVINNGTAIISFFSDEINGFEVNRLRLLMLLKDSLQKFIEVHYESDSITAFVNERVKLKEYEKLSHGFKDYLENLTKVAHNPNEFENRNSLIDVLYDIVKRGPILQNLIAPIEEKRKAHVPINRSFLESKENSDISNGLDIQCWSLNCIMKYTEDLIKLIVKNEVAGSQNYSDKKIDINIVETNNTKIEIEFSLTIFRTIISEVVVNAKKRQLLSNKDFNFSIEVSHDNDDSNLYWIEFKNTVDKVEGEDAISLKKLLQLQKNTIQFNTKGLGLIKKLCFVSTGHFPFIDYDFNASIFLIKIPLKTIYHE